MKPQRQRDFARPASQRFPTPEKREALAQVREVVITAVWLRPSGFQRLSQACLWRVNLDEKRATNKVRNVSRREDDAGVD